MVPDSSFAENPILVRFRRGDRIESVHRGAWVVTDANGSVQKGRGAFQVGIYARSAVKCMQALPLIETGAAAAIGYRSRELALALSSHNGEDQHTDTALGVLERLGLGEEHLLCGSSPPGDRETRERLLLAKTSFGPLHHNCSGKHAGFLTLGKHLGVAPEAYLRPDSASQELVREALLEMTGADEGDLSVAIDGCSAPTFRLPLAALARSFAAFTTPRGMSASRTEACATLLQAAQEHPELIAGKYKRLCTAILKASKGRLFPKIGAEGVYAIGHVGKDQALAVKMDDGGLRGVHALVVALLEQFGWLDEHGLAALTDFRSSVVRNAAKLEVGALEVDVMDTESMEMQS